MQKCSDEVKESRGSRRRYEVQAERRRFAFRGQFDCIVFAIEGRILYSERGLFRDFRDHPSEVDAREKAGRHACKQLL